MIDAIEFNLQRGIKLLQNLSEPEYTNESIPPYYSSIGCHIRHILDVFSCILKGFEAKKVDLTNRERNQSIEQNIEFGIAYFEEIIFKIRSFSEEDLQSEIILIDDLGLGKMGAKTTLAAVLIQAHSHAIHHFASIGYCIYQLGVELPDADFGYNPTTPKNILK
ncbi:DinB family protein [Polaribacter gangjinensis]|uniref:DinB-like domain-containing protein n=1 Tax=Polaribacter gangjinensis TaxID=574710 RepID=A0A2S7W8M5_9FLAO|nr:DinB family protein [Polaribacter gangjinensis]PQJ73943.1 hypothetical protein BTO13_01000 [Polaribacter gangjinensis]